MTKTGWLKGQWATLPPDDSPLLGGRGRIWETYIILSAICQNTAFWTACRYENWEQPVLIIHARFHNKICSCHSHREKFRLCYRPQFHLSKRRYSESQNICPPKIHLERWYDQIFYFVRSEMECYAGMEKLAQDIERDEDWRPEMFEETEDDELSDDV